MARKSVSLGMTDVNDIIDDLCFNNKFNWMYSLF